METLIYNIDSNDRNKTSYSNSHNFTYNKVDTTIDSVVRVEPFNVKNVIEINVSSVEIPNTFYYINSTKGNNSITTVSVGAETIPDGSYTKEELMTALATTTGVSGATYSSTTGKVTLTTGSNFTFTNISDYPSLGEILGYEDGTTYTTGTAATNAMTLPQEPYVFLKINDLGNIIHKDKRYVAKLVPDNSSRFDDLNRETVYRTLSTRIIFDQPIDIKELKISLVDSAGNLSSLNNANFSFSFEVKTISNSLLKQYEEMKFFNSDVSERILNARMLEYYDRENKNHTLTNQYSKNTQQQHNNIEYTSMGNRNNYNYNDGFFRK
tara:strand:+ start:2572 stop:3543 length:972 start_codon:yes stop_codon:yes gene_type:complete